MVPYIDIHCHLDTMVDEIDKITSDLVKFNVIANGNNFESFFFKNTSEK